MGVGILPEKVQRPQCGGPGGVGGVLDTNLGESRCRRTSPELRAAGHEEVMGPHVESDTQQRQVSRLRLSTNPRASTTPALGIPSSCSPEPTSLSPPRPEPSSALSTGPEKLECVGPNLQMEAASKGGRADTEVAIFEDRHQDRFWV